MNTIQKSKKETELKTRNELLEEGMKHLQQEIKEAHEILTSMKVPTNGLDANGELGWGKRENLTLKQRITYLKYCGN